MNQTYCRRFKRTGVLKKKTPKQQTKKRTPKKHNQQQTTNLKVPALEEDLLADFFK